MENSSTEMDRKQTFHSPPRRRRSTFFERRDSIVPQCQQKNEDPNESNDDIDRNAEALARYYNTLLVEKEQWKKEVNKRKNHYHDLRQQYEIAAEASNRSRISYSSLTNEDIDFLKNKPNISKLVDSQQKLHKSVKETRALFRRVNELDNIVLSYSEEKIQKVTDFILENSTVQPMESE